MKILTRYIGKTIGINIFIVALLLVSLETFFSLLAEMDTVGKGNYHFNEAFYYIILTIPRRLYEMLAPATLLGTLLGLGELAHHHELVVMRAAGVTMMQLTWAALRAGIVVMLFAFVIGEWVAPPSEQKAQRLRSMALTQQIAMRTRYGFWARDGQTYVNIRQYLPGGRLAHIFIYQLDDNQKLKVAANVETAYYENHNWQLQNIKESYIENNQITVLKQAAAKWDSRLNPDILSVVVVKPENLSLTGLYQYIQYLQANDQDANRYQLAFWNKIITPLSTLVMVLVAIPFVFGPLRSTSIGSRIIVGAMVGLAFHLINQIISQLGQVNNFSPLLSASLPSFVFLAIAIRSINKIN